MTTARGQVKGVSQSELQIFPEDPEAASFRKNLEGWVSRDGRYWGADERMARWDGATHIHCKTCNSVHVKNGFCSKCWDRTRQEKFEALPTEPWDGESMLYSHLLDEWATDLESFYEEYEAQYDEALSSDAELQIQHCRPVFAREVESYYWLADGPPDQEDLPAALKEALDSFNDKIRAIKEPLYWALRPARMEV